MKLTVNGNPQTFDDDPEMPLLWYLRDELALTGAKFGCGAGLCGACTVHVDGRATRSCVTPMSALKGRQVTTIEHLGVPRLHAVQKAWIDNDVAQCGYCQTGQIMAVVDLLKRHPAPSDAQIDTLHTNICRCGTYTRMRKAIHHAARLMQQERADD